MSRVITNEQLIVPAKISYLPILRNFVSRLGSKYKFSKSEVNALTISVDEACTNIIKHGYQDIQSGSITMNVHIKTDRFEVELIDYGTSFDPNQVNDPNISHYVQARKKGGLGIFIMKKFLDDIQYFRSGQANILRLIKFRKDTSIYSLLIPIISAIKKMIEKLLPGKHKIIEKKIQA